MVWIWAGLTVVRRFASRRFTSSIPRYRYLRTHQEIVRFLAAARQVDPSLRALRRSRLHGHALAKLAGLLWQRVNLDRRLITVAASYDGPTKGGYVRHVPIVDALLPILKAWRVECPTPSDYVFPSSRGTMLRPSARVFQGASIRSWITQVLSGSRSGVSRCDTSSFTAFDTPSLATGG